MVDIDRSVIEVAFSESRRPLFSAGESPTDDAAEAAAADSTVTNPSERRSVAGRLAVVTGATGLLGATLAAELLQRGAHVCLVGRDLDALRDTVGRLPSPERTAMLRCDLASAEDVESAADFVERIGMPVDVLVHAASVHAPTTIAEGTVGELDEHYLLDVRGPYLLTQRLLPSLVDAAGRVVFFAAGDSPDTSIDGADAHRAISQAGLAALAAALRDEVAAKGVRVLTVRSDDDMDPTDAGPETIEFLEICAGTVLDVLAAGRVDVTGLQLRRGSRRVAAGRR